MIDASPPPRSTATDARAWPQHSPAADALTLFVVFFALALGAIAVARQPGTVAVVWIANGAATAFIVSAPRARTFYLLAVVALANLTANLAWGDPLRLALAFVPANVLEVALGVVLTRQAASHFADDHRSYLRVLLRGAAWPPLVGATLGSAVLNALDFGHFERVWLDWYVGSALGSVVALSLGLALRGRGLAAGLAQLARPQVLLSLAGTVALTWLVFSRLPYPFVWATVWLTLLAYAQPRLATFANAFTLVVTLEVAIAFGTFVPAPTPARGPWNDAAIYLSTLAVVLPPLLVAVMLARQRALGEMLAAIGSRTDDLVVFVDMQGVYRWANRARADYWGVPNAQILGRRWAETVGEPRYTTSIKPLLDRALAGESVHALSEVTYPRRGTRTMDVSMQPALDEEGRQIGVLSCASDVTELETARRDLEHKVAQLHASNASLDQFVRIASHDLREPMNTIDQFVQLIEDSQRERLDAAGRLYFAQVRDGAQRMKAMLDDVLQFVRLEGEEAPPREPVDLDAVMAEVRRSLGARLQATQAQLEVGPLGSVWGRRSLLMVVLQNLVGNALKFVPPDRLAVVRVSARRASGRLCIEVRDNGIGIEPARLGELGTPFRRLHARRKFEGTGLGLAICKRIAEQHGGAIEVESTPGEGSCFALCLPERGAERG